MLLLGADRYQSILTQKFHIPMLVMQYNNNGIPLLHNNLFDAFEISYILENIMENGALLLWSKWSIYHNIKIQKYYGNGAFASNEQMLHLP